MPEPKSVQTEHEITQLLHAWGQGDEDAFNQLYEMVYADLRRLAHNFLRKEPPGHLLQTTGLVNEVYLKFKRSAPRAWESRVHFRRVCALAMRHLLIDMSYVRPPEEQLPDDYDVPWQKPSDLVALDDALMELEKSDPELALVVDLKFYNGMTFEEIAEELGQNEKTYRLRWQKAKEKLYQLLNQKDDPEAKGTTQSLEGAAAQG